MPKNGRNAPCPCGSGKKFKRCCGAPGTDRVVPTPGWALRRRLPDPRTLDSEQIRLQLDEWGIAADPDAFRAGAGYAAQSVAEKWLENISPETRAAVDEDFVFGAAIELWRRECPDRPSTEMLMGWIEEGHDLERQRKSAKTCVVWSKVWSIVLDRLPPSVRTTGEADKALGWDEFLMNLIGDLQTAFLNAAHRDSEYAEQGVRFSREVLDRFSGESTDFLTCVRADLGDLLGCAGRTEEAERELTALITEYPRAARGYCHLAELYRRSGPRRALAILEQAVAVPVEDGADYDLDSRISDLRRSLTACSETRGSITPSTAAGDEEQDR